MQFTEKDFKDSKKVSEIIKFIDLIDRKYIDTESDVIFKKQPFIISLILGYRIDFNEEEFEEITKVLLIIWEYFKDKNRIQTKQITEEQFEKFERRNIQMLKYLEGEKNIWIKLTSFH